MQRHFRITWEIDLDADGPASAAKLALDIQRDAKSMATVFEVYDEEAGRTWKIDIDPADHRHVSAVSAG
jgi:hypothetical protein